MNSYILIWKCPRRAEFLHAWAIKPCSITARNTMSNEIEKKNCLNILRVKIKDFIVPLLNVLSIICTLKRVNNQRSKKLNVCMSKMHLHLTFRWTIQNFALLKQHIFLICENWSILLLLQRNNFRVFCLNSAALKPTFHFVWKKARYFAESIWQICLKGPFFTENAILKNKIVWKAFYAL